MPCQKIIQPGCTSFCDVDVAQHIHLPLFAVGTSKAAQGALDSSAPPSREEVSRPEEQQVPSTFPAQVNVHCACTPRHARVAGKIHSMQEM